MEEQPRNINSKVCVRLDSDAGWKQCLLETSRKSTAGTISKGNLLRQHSISLLKVTLLSKLLPPETLPYTHQSNPWVDHWLFPVSSRGQRKVSPGQVSDQ